MIELKVACLLLACPCIVLSLLAHHFFLAHHIHGTILIELVFLYQQGILRHMIDKLQIYSSMLINTNILYFSSVLFVVDLFFHSYC